MRKILTPNGLELQELTGNLLKTLIQINVVDHFDKLHNLICEIVTGFGKTVIAMEVIRRNKGKSINIVVPKINLKTQWEEKLSKEGLLEYVNIYVINTYTMFQHKVDNLRPDILIVDEGHRCLNEESENFSTLLDISPLSKTLILSASLKEKHKAFLDSRGLRTYYEITKHWAYSHGLVPFHTPINCPVDLTSSEMSMYLSAHDDIIRCEIRMQAGFIYDAFEKDERKIARCARELGVEIGKVKGQLARWKKAINQRKEVLYNAANKKYVAAEILALIPDKVMVFCKSKKFADDLRELDPLATVRYSTQKAKEGREAMANFVGDFKPHMISVDMLKEGVDIPDCNYALRAAYGKDSGDTTQITGRTSRFDESNPNKETFLINLFVRSFMARGELVESQELKWLIENQKLEYNIVWFDSALDVVNYVEQIFQK